MKWFEPCKRHRWVVLAVLCAALLAAWIYPYYGGSFSREALLTYGKRLSPVWFIAGFFALPLAGVPISVLLFLAGIRFGPWGGMALAAGGVFFHNLVAYHLVHRWFRDRLRNRIQRSGYKVPAIATDHQAWFTMLFAAIHGPPYAMKLYLLALTEIPFHIYFWAGAPVYLLFCLIPVGAGSAVVQVNATLLYGIVIGISIFSLGGIWLKRRFGSQL